MDYLHAAGRLCEYAYDASHRMLTIKDARGIVYLTNQYDSNGRVNLQTQADNTTYQFPYTLGGNGNVTVMINNPQQVNIAADGGQQVNVQRKAKRCKRSVDKRMSGT